MKRGSVENEDDQRVQEYYDYTRRFYKYFWHGDTNAIHYGFHDATTPDSHSALLRTIQVTAESVTITASDIVADLGSGIGGSAFCIAKNIGARVSGVTISREQYKKALKLRAQYSLENYTSFVFGDFLKTPFADNQFDVVFGLEALCYAQHVIDELAIEMFRITKPGGRVSVMDGFLGMKDLSFNEKSKIATFEEGFALTKMITPISFMDALKKVGFTEVSYHDYTNEILPTAERMYKLSRRWHLFTRVAVKLGLVPGLMLKNNLTGLVQRDLFKSRALVYGCITAKK